MSANFAHQFGGAAVLGGRLQKVAACTGPQVLGLADIDHPAGGVFHQIDAGRLRKFAHLGRRMGQAERLRLVPRDCRPWCIAFGGGRCRHAWLRRLFRRRMSRTLGVAGFWPSSYVSDDIKRLSSSPQGHC